MDAPVLMLAFVWVFGSFWGLLQNVDAKCTEIGEFGETGCQYQCHCEHWNECNNTNGRCGSAGCHDGYAGTACQYENLAYKQAVRTNISVFGSQDDLATLVDGDKKSCVLENGNSSLPLFVSLGTVSWADVIQVNLFNHTISRITTSAEDLQVEYLSDDDSNTTTTTMLRAHLPGPHDMVLMYYLPRPARVTGVQIHALRNKSLALCEVSVFGGRNLAMRKNATQGEATYMYNKSSASAEFAVDGKTECPNTKHSRTTSLVSGQLPQQSWWAVLLGYRLNIWRVTIYNKLNPDQLNAFALNVTMRDSSEVTVYRHNDSTANDIADIILPEPVAATQLKIRREEPGRALELCEVEVFGDCEDGYFGWLCDKSCGCRDRTEVCDKLWGFCPKSQCRAGYKGDDCQEECSPGTHGLNCSQNCSSTCANDVCDHVTGRCTNGCVAGWEGETCDQECTSGTYGLNCSLACSNSCVGDVCDHVTGRCTNDCPPGKQGEKCDQDCNEGFYGQNCNTKCSERCRNATCQAESGHCLAGCVHGFTGKLCQQRKKKKGAEEEGGVNWTALAVSLVFIVIAVIGFIACLFWWWRRRSSDAAAKDEEDGQGSEKEEEEEEGRQTGTGQSGNDLPLSEVGNSQPKPSSAEAEPESTPTPKPRTVFTTTTDAITTTTDATTTATTASPATPTPTPRTSKPQLVSLFSRDASEDPPEDLADPGQATSTAEEKTSPTDGGSSSTKHLLGTPKPARRLASFESLETASVDNLSVTSTPPRSRRGTGDSRDSMDAAGDGGSPLSTLLPLHELPARVAQWLENPRHFSKERSMLPTGKQYDWMVALQPHNLGKNRYKDIFPYDHSRVQLAPLPDDPNSDFYNACYIDGYKTEREYIAAQGPMEKTLHDFLRLVWDAECRRIVMLTKTAEMGRFKCQQYWPDDEGVLTSADISVHVQRTSVFADYTLRHLSVERGGETRLVTMYHYLSWPDNSTPASPWSLLQFRQKVRQGATPDEGPIIVHCSAGIGRTGTYLALDILLSRALNEQEVDVFQCVGQLRQQRINMVQTLAQYIFIHEALRASVLSSRPVPVGEFTLDHLLHEKEGVRPIDTEYERLQMCLGPVQTEDTENSTPPELVGLPRDRHRVNIMSVTDKRWGSAFINAVFLSNCKQAEAYIQTHSPADPGAAIHFLSMVVQHHVTCVVNLDSEEDETFPYWPETTNTHLELHPYTVTLMSMRKAQGMMVRNMRISFPASLGTGVSILEAEDMVSQEVTQVTCSAWPPSRQTPQSVSVILDIVDHVTAHADQPVVVHCRDGHTRSGLVIVAAAVLEEFRTEGHVAVNYVTAHMRVPRRENIVSVEQYEFLYACVEHQRNPNRGSDVITGGSDEADDNLYGNIDGALQGATANETNSTEEENTYGNVDSAPNKQSGKVEENGAAESENTYGNIDTVLIASDASNGYATGNRDEVLAKEEENLYGNV